MEIKDYVKQFFAKQSDKVERRDLQKSHKKVRVADFCRENMLDYYEMVEALKQDKFESESYEGQVQCGDIVMQTEAQENKIQEKDSEVLRLLNQIATDMIRKSDVDRLIEEAVAKATAALKADYEERMKAMAAEYEAKIAEIRNQKDGKGDDKDQTPGKSTKNSRKKGGTVICNSMEEAMQRIQEEMNKAAVMQDQAFGGGSEKLSSEQKPAVNPENENADDDSKVQSPVNPRGNYGERNNESILNDMYQDLLYYANTATAKCGELLMKAINYAKAEWAGLIRYTEDGRYRVDNNAAESIMRDLACGRKNFLFCGSDNAAKPRAMLASLVEEPCLRIFLDRELQAQQ